MEDYKRKKKSVKAKRNKELYGKYNSKKIRQIEKKANSQKIEFLSKSKNFV